MNSLSALGLFLFVLIAAGASACSPKRSHPTLARGTWDTPLAPGEEADPITLLRLQKEIDRWQSDVLAKTVGNLKSHSFADLPLKDTNVQLYHVELNMTGPTGIYRPMWGSGTTYVLKVKERFYLLTRTNFARAFGPVTDKTKLWPYLTAYEHVFGDPYASLVPDGGLVRPARNGAFPERSMIQRTEDGFHVRLILLHYLGWETIDQKRLFVHEDGIVDEGPKKTLRRLGPGMLH